jgi:hypothetical protein
MCSCANEEEDHEDCLRRDINPLDWWTTRCPDHRRIWRTLAVCLLTVSCKLLLMEFLVNVVILLPLEALHLKTPFC